MYHIHIKTIGIINTSSIDKIPIISLKKKLKQ